MARLTAFATLALWVIYGPALAQGTGLESLGAVKEVHGVVTMSIGSQVATVLPETPVFDGARFVAGSSGNAQLRFDNGCTLDLKPNEWVTIDGNLDCPRQIAAIQSVTNLAGSGFFASGGATVPLLSIAALTGVVVKVAEIDITPRPR